MVKVLLHSFTISTCLLLACKESYAQFTDSVTHRVDSSYSNYRAFISTRKTHPDIRLVEPEPFKKNRRTKNIVYSRIGSRTLLMDAFLPVKNQANRTAVIMIHGGGWRSGNRSQHDAMLQRLSDLGYVCFSPEYRLSTEALFPAAVHDIKAAIRFVRDHAHRFNLDTARIAIAGFSAGGQLAALMATTANMPLFEGQGGYADISSAVNALIDIDGTLSFVHPESGEANDEKKISASTMWFGYSKKDNLPLLTIASPLTHVNAYTPPTLFINSSIKRMHAGRSDFVRVLNDHKIYSRVKEFERSPHSFCLFEPWFTPTVQEMDNFLKKVFNNDEN